MREIIALRIIEAANKGERDPDRLRNIALSGLRNAQKATRRTSS